MAHPDANKPVPERLRRQGFVRDRNTGKLVRTDANREEARRKGGVDSVRLRDLERQGKMRHDAEGGRYKSAVNISHDYLVNMATHHLNQFKTLKGFWDDIKTLRDDAMKQRWRYGGEMKNPDKWTDRYIERWLNHNVLEIWRRTHGLEAQMKIEEFKQKFFAERMKVKQIKRKKDTPKFIADIWGDKTTTVGKKKYKTELRGTTQRTVEVKGRGRPGGHARRVDYTTKSRRVRKMLPDWPRKTTRSSQWEISRGTVGKKPNFKRNIPTKQLVKPHDDWIKSKTKKRKHAEGLYAFASGDIARFIDATIDNVSELTREVQKKYGEIKRQLFDVEPTQMGSDPTNVIPGQYKREIHDNEDLYRGIIERAEPMLARFERQESELLAAYVDGIARLGMSENDLSSVDQVRLNSAFRDLDEETWKLRDTLEDETWNEALQWSESKMNSETVYAADILFAEKDEKKSKKKKIAGAVLGVAGAALGVKYRKGIKRGAVAAKRTPMAVQGYRKSGKKPYGRIPLTKDQKKNPRRQGLRNVSSRRRERDIVRGARYGARYG